MTGVEVETFHGASGELHSMQAPTGGPRRLWHLIPDGPAVVLGSTQRLVDVDSAAAALAGVEVVNRRSGGGAVWVEASDPLWLDVWIPRDDRAWTDDVGQAFEPIGLAWIDALESLGVAGLTTHTGAMACYPGSRQVCFAGVGPGEVMFGDRKLVGISQRRTRDGARFQCALYRRWDPSALHGLLADPPPLLDLRARALGLDDVAAGSVRSADVIAALAAALG